MMISLFIQEFFSFDNSKNKKIYLFFQIILKKSIYISRRVLYGKG